MVITSYGSIGDEEDAINKIDIEVDNEDQSDKDPARRSSIGSPIPSTVSTAHLTKPNYVWRVT